MTGIRHLHAEALSYGNARFHQSYALSLLYSTLAELDALLSTIAGRDVSRGGISSTSYNSDPKHQSSLSDMFKGTPMTKMRGEVSTSKIGLPTPINDLFTNKDPNSPGWLRRVRLMFISHSMAVRRPQKARADLGLFAARRRPSNTSRTRDPSPTLNALHPRARLINGTQTSTLPMLSTHLPLIKTPAMPFQSRTTAPGQVTPTPPPSRFLNSRLGGRLSPLRRSRGSTPRRGSRCLRRRWRPSWRRRFGRGRGLEWARFSRTGCSIRSFESVLRLLVNREVLDI